MTWQTKKLGEVVQIQNGFAFKSSEYVDSGFFVMRITNVQDGFIALNNPEFIKKNDKSFEKFILNEGDILMSLTGNVGRVGVVKKECLPAVLNQRVARLLVSDENKLDKNYLFNFLRSPKFFNEVVAGGRGMAQQNVSTKDIENLEIPLPPLSEQKKIVKILNEKMGKIAEMKKLREASLADTEKILSQTIHEIFEEGKKNGWGEKKLEDVCIKNENIKWAKNRTNTFRYVDLSSVSRETFSIMETKEVNEKNAPSRAKKIILTDDVIFGTTRPTLMRMVIISEKYNEQLCSTGFCILRANRKKISPFFIYYFLRSSQFMDRMDKAQTGAIYPAVSDSKVLESLIPLPSLVEQQKIVKRLDVLSEKIRQAVELQKSQLEDLKKLEKSYLREAFNGEL